MRSDTARATPARRVQTVRRAGDATRRDRAAVTSAARSGSPPASSTRGHPGGSPRPRHDGRGGDRLASGARQDPVRRRPEDAEELSPQVPGTGDRTVDSRREDGLLSEGMAHLFIRSQEGPLRAAGLFALPNASQQADDRAIAIPTSTRSDPPPRPASVVSWIYTTRFQTVEVREGLKPRDWERILLHG